MKTSVCFHSQTPPQQTQIPPLLESLALTTSVCFSGIMTAVAVLKQFPISNLLWNPSSNAIIDALIVVRQNEDSRRQ